MEKQGVLGSSWPSLQPGSGLSHNFFFFPFLIENGFFSHKIYTDHSFLQGTISNHDETRQKTGQKLPYGGWTRRDKRRERIPRAGKSHRHTHPQLEVSQKHQADSLSIYAEGQVQTHTGPVLAASDSLSPCELCLVDSAGHVLLVSSIPLTLTIVPASFWGFPRALRGGPRWRPAG